MYKQRTHSRFSSLIQLGMLLIPVTAALLISSSSAGQSISGSVSDVSGNPLPGATVFFEGTTRGDVASRTGGFSISSPGPGTWVLVVSHLGFAPAARTVHISGHASIAVGHVTLKAISFRLPELVIEASREDQERFERRFEIDFLGSTAAATQAKIINPDVLRYVSTARGFRVEALEPIIVENRATGYRSIVYLHDYERFPRGQGLQAGVARVFRGNGGADTPPASAENLSVRRLATTFLMGVASWEAARGGVFCALPHHRTHDRKWLGIGFL